uniref:Uncharacterized protein n=1 Tax=Sander lucioperca TaxID=283035 RepID=A0A8C9ZEV4_SANLU
MIMPPAITLVLCAISCKTGMLPSPDLNPIEHELAGALVEEWGNISQQELANLVQSMRRRCTILTVTFDFDHPLFRDTLFHFC